MSDLKTLVLQSLSEPEFYGGLVYKVRKIIGKNDFSYHFKKISVRYKKNKLYYRCFATNGMLGIPIGSNCAPIISDLYFVLL